MYHPLYYQATRYAGKTVYVHHRNGQIYHGTLLSVAPHGVYLIRHRPGTVMMASGAQSLTANEVNLLDNKDNQQNFGANGTDDMALVYAPASYFAFGALAGLTVGAIAGAYMW